jgi:hypothetical protein
MLLKLRLPQKFESYSPPSLQQLSNRYRIPPYFFNRLRTRGPSSDPRAKTAFSTKLQSIPRLETEPAVLAN